MVTMVRMDYAMYIMMKSLHDYFITLSFPDKALNKNYVTTSNKLVLPQLSQEEFDGVSKNDIPFIRPPYCNRFWSHLMSTIIHSLKHVIFAGAWRCRLK